MNAELALQQTIASRLRALPELSGLEILLEAAEDFEATFEKAQAAQHPLYLIVATPEEGAPAERHPSTDTGTLTLTIELAYQIGPITPAVTPSAATALIKTALHGTPGPRDLLYYRGYTTARTDTQTSRLLSFDTP